MGRVDKQLIPPRYALGRVGTDLCLRLLALLAGLLLWPMGAGAWGESVPGVEVVDTGIEVARGETEFTAEWLDERRVAFSELIDSTAYEKRKANDPREYEQIVIYDVMSKEKQVYAKGSMLRCLKNGRIAYSAKVPDEKNPNGYRSALMLGGVGSEQPVTQTAERFLHSADCAMQERVPEHKFGRLIRYLKREHGFIDGGNNFGNGEDKYSFPAVLHRPGLPPVKLPFMGAYIGDGSPRWSEYWGGYILNYVRGGDAPPRDVTPPPSETRLLKPDGQVTVFSHGGGQTRNRAIQFRRTNWTVEKAGDSGVYVYDDAAWVRVHKGLILPVSSNAGHSPDGCRVAFASRQAFLYDVPAYLMILNVCGEKK